MQVLGDVAEVSGKFVFHKKEYREAGGYPLISKENRIEETKHRAVGTKLPKYFITPIGSLKLISRTVVIGNICM